MVRCELSHGCLDELLLVLEVSELLGDREVGLVDLLVALLVYSKQLVSDHQSLSIVELQTLLAPAHGQELLLDGDVLLHLAHEDLPQVLQVDLHGEDKLLEFLLLQRQLRESSLEVLDLQLQILDLCVLLAELLVQLSDLLLVILFFRSPICALGILALIL